MARPKEIENPVEYSVMVEAHERAALDRIAAMQKPRPISRAAATRLAVKMLIQLYERDGLIEASQKPS
jgi:hypothetical protein